MEITVEIAPLVDVLLGLPEETMRIPTLREAMMIAELYDLVPIDELVWQAGRFKGLDRHHPAGLEHSHDGDISNIHFYDVRKESKHKHNPHISFRLIGELAAAA